MTGQIAATFCGSLLDEEPEPQNCQSSFWHVYQELLKEDQEPNVQIHFKDDLLSVQLSTKNKSSCHGSLFRSSGVGSYVSLLSRWTHEMPTSFTPVGTFIVSQLFPRPKQIALLQVLSNLNPNTRVHSLDGLSYRVSKWNSVEVESDIVWDSPVIPTEQSLSDGIQAENVFSTVVEGESFSVLVYSVANESSHIVTTAALLHEKKEKMALTAFNSTKCSSDVLGEIRSIRCIEDAECSDVFFLIEGEIDHYTASEVSTGTMGCALAGVKILEDALSLTGPYPIGSKRGPPTFPHKGLAFNSLGTSALATGRKERHLLIARPKYRFWTADFNGLVQSTLKIACGDEQRRKQSVSWQMGRLDESHILCWTIENAKSSEPELDWCVVSLKSLSVVFQLSSSIKVEGHVLSCFWWEENQTLGVLSQVKSSSSIYLHQISILQNTSYLTVLQSTLRHFIVSGCSVESDCQKVEELLALVKGEMKTLTVARVVPRQPVPQDLLDSLQRNVDLAKQFLRRPIPAISLANEIKIFSSVASDVIDGLKVTVKSEVTHSENQSFPNPLDLASATCFPFKPVAEVSTPHKKSQPLIESTSKATKRSSSFSFVPHTLQRQRRRVSTGKPLPSSSTEVFSYSTCCLDSVLPRNNCWRACRVIPCEGNAQPSNVEDLNAKSTFAPTRFHEVVIPVVVNNNSSQGFQMFCPSNVEADVAPSLPSFKAVCVEETSVRDFVEQIGRQVDWREGTASATKLHRFFNHGSVSSSGTEKSYCSPPILSYKIFNLVNRTACIRRIPFLSACVHHDWIPGLLASVVIASGAKSLWVASYCFSRISACPFSFDHATANSFRRTQSWRIPCINDPLLVCVPCGSIATERDDGLPQPKRLRGIIRRRSVKTFAFIEEERHQFLPILLAAVVFRKHAASLLMTSILSLLTSSSTASKSLSSLSRSILCSCGKKFNEGGKIRKTKMGRAQTCRFCTGRFTFQNLLCLKKKRKNMLLSLLALHRLCSSSVERCSGRPPTCSSPASKHSSDSHDEKLTLSHSKLDRHALPPWGVALHLRRFFTRALIFALVSKDVIKALLEKIVKPHEVRVMSLLMIASDPNFRNTGDKLQRYDFRSDVLKYWNPKGIRQKVKGHKVSGANVRRRLRQLWIPSVFRVQTKVWQNSFLEGLARI